MKALVFLFKIGLLFVLVIHFIIKDAFYWSSILFYALPLPIIMVLTLIVLPFTKNALRIRTFIILMFLGTCWCFQSLAFNYSTEKEEGFEIIYWNAGHIRGFEDAFKEAKNKPDVMVLIEYDTTDYKSIHLKFPEYHFYLSNANIGLFSKTPIKNVQGKKTGRNSNILKFKTNGLNFFAVDVTPNIFNFRKKELEFIYNNIDSSENTIVLGDFNTPLESLYYENFKTEFNHAFSKSGTGFKETWFWNLPLLSLDHIWTSKDLNLIHTEKIYSIKSDHAMLKTIINH